MVANDGNLMQHTVPFPNAQSQDLPTQGIAERYDIVIDFKNLANGTKLYMVNLLEHVTGMGPNRGIPLASILDGTYAGDPAVGAGAPNRIRQVGQLSSSQPDFGEPHTGHFSETLLML